MMMCELRCGSHYSISSSSGEISSLQISARKLNFLLLQWGKFYPLLAFSSSGYGISTSRCSPTRRCTWLCLICVFFPTACPQGCLQCSHKDRCHLCDHGFFLKSGFCMPTCVPGFSGHSSNETCTGKLIPAGSLVMLPVIPLCRRVRLQIRLTSVTWNSAFHLCRDPWCYTRHCL